jgi:hypothetical protein
LVGYFRWSEHPFELNSVEEASGKFLAMEGRGNPGMYMGETARKY